MYVTNYSVFVQWKIDPVNCSKLNGFVSMFYIELKVNYGSNRPFLILIKYIFLEGYGRWHIKNNRNETKLPLH